MLGPIMLHYKRKAMPLDSGKPEDQTDLLLPNNFAISYFLEALIFQ
jgi:hypothetical protein